MHTTRIYNFNQREVAKLSHLRAKGSKVFISSQSHIRVCMISFLKVFTQLTEKMDGYWLFLTSVIGL